MGLSCPYCCETFNKSSNLPMKLSCNHVLCSSCIQFFKHHQYIRFCPLDSQIIDYSSAKPCQKTLKALNSVCSLHNFLIIALCKDHIQPLCESCLENHQKCASVLKGVEELENLINDIIEQSREKAERVIEKSNDKIIEEFSDWINWLRYEVNTKISDLKEIYKIENIIKVVKSNHSHLENLLQEAKETTNLIGKILEPKIRNSEESKTKIDQENETKISSENETKIGLENETKICLENDQENDKSSTKLIQEFWATRKFHEKFVEHLILIRDKEIKKIKSKTPILLIFTYIIPEEIFEDECTMIIENSYHMPILVLGISIGMPIDSEGYSFIEKITIIYEDSTQKIENIILDYRPEQLTHIVYLESLIIWTPSSKITLIVVYQCFRSYLFLSIKKTKFLKAYDLDGNEYIGNSPIFGFIVDSLD